MNLLGLWKHRTNTGFLLIWSLKANWKKPLISWHWHLNALELHLLWLLMRQLVTYCFVATLLLLLGLSLVNLIPNGNISESFILTLQQLTIPNTKKNVSSSYINRICQITSMISIGEDQMTNKWTNFKLLCYPLSKVQQ